LPFHIGAYIDDFYRYANGKWLANTTIPPDKGRLFVLQQLSDQVHDQLRGLIESPQKDIDRADLDQKKIVDLYASFTNEAAVDRLDLQPLQAELAKVDAVTVKAQISALIAHFNHIGIAAPYTPQIHQDAKDPSRYVFDLSQDGLGMPDRAYYLQDDKLKQIRALYVAHVAKMMSLAGDLAAASDSQSVLALESALAKAQWSEVDNRDPIKIYNKLSFVALAGIAPRYDWKAPSCWRWGMSRRILWPRLFRTIRRTRSWHCTTPTRSSSLAATCTSSMPIHRTR
jgi:putative endopeptidase